MNFILENGNAPKQIAGRDLPLDQPKLFLALSALYLTPPKDARKENGTM